MESKADELSTDNTNDKENEQNASSPKAETAKKKVIEAPPPKVNPWTKRNACPPNNATNNSSIQTGREFMLTTHSFIPPTAIILMHTCALLARMCYCKQERPLNSCQFTFMTFFACSCTRALKHTITPFILSIYDNS